METAVADHSEGDPPEDPGNGGDDVPGVGRPDCIPPQNPGHGPPDCIPPETPRGPPENGGNNGNGDSGDNGNGNGNGGASIGGLANGFGL